MEYPIYLAEKQESLHNTCIMDWMPGIHEGPSRRALLAGCTMLVYSLMASCHAIITKQHHACSSPCVGKRLHHFPRACMITPASCTNKRKLFRGVALQIRSCSHVAKVGSIASATSSCTVTSNVTASSAGIAGSSQHGDPEGSVVVPPLR